MERETGQIHFMSDKEEKHAVGETPGETTSDEKVRIYAQ